MHLLHNAAHFATIALEREHWVSLANQRALDLAAERERVRGLEALLVTAAATVNQDRRGMWYFDLGDPEELMSQICEAVGHEAIDTARKALGKRP